MGQLQRPFIPDSVLSLCQPLSGCPSAQSHLLPPQFALRDPGKVRCLWQGSRRECCWQGSSSGCAAISLSFPQLRSGCPEHTSRPELLAEELGELSSEITGLKVQVLVSIQDSGVWEARQAGFAAGGEFCLHCPGQAALGGQSWGSCHPCPQVPWAQLPPGLGPGPPDPVVLLTLVGRAGAGGLNWLPSMEVWRGLSHRDVQPAWSSLHYLRWVSGMDPLEPAPTAS